MQITETFSQGLKKSFEITFTSKEVETKLEAQLANIGKKVKVPGFRPGKVPLSLLKQRYQSEALSDVLEKCAEGGIQKVVKDNDLKLALKPKVNLKSFELGKDLIFTIDLEVLPTIEEIKLDNLSFEKHVVTIPDETITRAIENLAKQTRKTRPLEKLRKTKKGDIAIIDFEGFVEEKPIEGGSGKAHALELGSGAFISGFEEQLIDQEKGAQLKIDVTFPKDYHETQYASKPARFDVTIIDIHEADPIIIDASLSEKLGFDSLQSMKEWVEKNISNNYTTQSFLNTKRHVLDALAERFTFGVPQNMVDLEFENIWNQLCREIGIDQDKAANANAKGKISSKTFEEATGKSEKELQEEYKLIAERRVRLGILLAEIGKRNNITVTNQELLNALTARAREFPGQEKEVFDFYRNNESAMVSLRAPIFENKVVDFILEQANVTETHITPAELEKLLVLEEERVEKMISSASKKSKKISEKKDV